MFDLRMHLVVIMDQEHNTVVICLCYILLKHFFNVTSQEFLVNVFIVQICNKAFTFEELTIGNPVSCRISDWYYIKALNIHNSLVSFE